MNAVLEEYQLKRLSGKKDAAQTEHQFLMGCEKSLCVNAAGQDSAALPPGNVNSGANSNKGFPSESVYKSGPT